MHQQGLATFSLFLWQDSGIGIGDPNLGSLLYVGIIQTMVYSRRVSMLIIPVQ